MQLMMTTAPRSKVVIHNTVSSLKTADFTNITVFCEPDSVEPDCQVIQNQTTLGAYTNWRRALSYACDNCTDWFGIVQDDLIVKPVLRNVLSNLYPDHVYSPYLSTVHHRSEIQGWFQVEAGFGLCGALFFCMHVDVAKQLFEVMPTCVPENKHIDGYLSLALEKLNIALFCHSPTLVKHLGDGCSTLGYMSNRKEWGW